MQQVTDTFAAAVRQSHVVAQQVDVLDAGQVVATLDTVVDGTVTEERADVRRRCDLQIVDADQTLTPDDAADLLAPFGNELRLYRGIRYPDDTSELVPLGTLVITSVQIDWPTITVTGMDRGWLAQQARFTAPYQIPRATNVTTAVQTLLEGRLPGYVDFNLTTTSETTTLLSFDTEQDPWQAAVELAAGIGMQLYPDRMGTIVMAAEPPLDGTPPARVFDETADGVLLGLTRSLSAETVINGVIAVGETTDDVAYRGEAWDDDPTSVTYRYGKFGQRPKFYSSPSISSATSATAAARAVLQRELGIADQLQFPSLVDPSLDVGDIIQVIRAESQVDAIHVLDSLTIPLRASGPMDAATRTRQSVL